MPQNNIHPSLYGHMPGSSSDFFGSQVILTLLRRTEEFLPQENRIQTTFSKAFLKIYYFAPMLISHIGWLE